MAQVREAGRVLGLDPSDWFVLVAGVVLVRQRPGNGNVVFCTIEDETGVANIVVWSSLLDRFRRAMLGSSLLLVAGRLQRSPEGIVHVIADRLDDRSAMMARITEAPLIVLVLWMGIYPASFLRPIPIKTPAAPIASRQINAQSRKRVFCSASTPRVICTATPTTRHVIVSALFVLPLAGVSTRVEEPSRMSTCSPVRAVIAAAVACNSARLFEL